MCSVRQLYRVLTVSPWYTALICCSLHVVHLITYPASPGVIFKQFFILDFPLMHTGQSVFPHSSVSAGDFFAYDSPYWYSTLFYYPGFHLGFALFCNLYCDLSPWRGKGTFRCCWTEYGERVVDITAFLARLPGIPCPLLLLFLFLLSSFLQFFSLWSCLSQLLS